MTANAVKALVFALEAAVSLTASAQSRVAAKIAIPEGMTSAIAVLTMDTTTVATTTTISAATPRVMVLQ